MRHCLLLLFTALIARAETHTLTLKQAVELAIAQNPEVVMARLDELKAAQGVDAAGSHFRPRVGIGSGLAYSSGFPLSIEGSAPAVFQARANQYLFNRPQTWAIAQAREEARGATFAAAGKGDEIAYRVASLYLDLARSRQLSEAAGKQTESLEKVLQTVQARIVEGRELPVSGQQANVNLLRSKQRALGLESDRDYASRSLAVTLGFAAGDLVQPAADEPAPPAIPQTEEAAVQTALAASRELKRMESSYSAKALEIKGTKSRRLPQVDLVAQYALLTRYSHYDQYFNAFQRNNGQIGASIQMPLFTDSATRAAISQSETDQRHISVEMQAARSRIALDVHQSYQEIQRAEIAKQLAQADLDLARSQLSILLAQMNEGRASLAQIEEARSAESEKWIAFYDAQFSAARARLNVLRQTGELRAALQ